VGPDTERPQLRLVFPDLAPTRRPGEPWTDTDITVDRPLGIRDASVCARGIESDRIPGSRWDRLIIDDLVNDENTRTPERRDWMHSLVQKRAISRVDARKGKVWWLSNAWHPDDSFQRHTKVWPTITLRIDGTILLRNAPDWDSDLIRPADDRDASDPDAEYRLVAHDAPEPDNDNAIPLWPERQPAEWIAEKRRELLPEAFAQGYLCICRDYSQSLCRPEYIAKCRAVATLLQLTTMFYRRSDCALPGLVFVGIDLAFSKQASADESAFFAVLVTPDRTCVPLGIEHGRWSADEIEQRFLDFYDRYQPAGIAVENIAAQEFVRQTLQRLDKHAPVKPHTTDKTKHNVFFGVPSIYQFMAHHPAFESADFSRLIIGGVGGAPMPGMAGARASVLVRLSMRLMMQPVAGSTVRVMKSFSKDVPVARNSSFAGGAVLALVSGFPAMSFDPAGSNSTSL